MGVGNSMHVPDHFLWKKEDSQKKNVERQRWTFNIIGRSSK